MNVEYFLQCVPKIEYLPSYAPKQETDWNGIKALWYEGARYKGKPTKVFAYIGMPKLQYDKKVPAVLLVHGGGGHAYAEWIKVWNQRGYAAIAMDTTGYVPSDRCRGLTGIENGPNEEYVKELYGELSDERYTLGPDNSGMLDCDLPLEEQWMYHAISDTILAHNILRNDKRIDSEKIGICGVSWGGVITSLTIGYDTRFAFAIPIYGSAYLGESEASCCKRFRDEKVQRYWNATDRLSKVSFPVFWLCWLPDPNFCCEANSRSYLATKELDSFLSIKDDMMHGHLVAWSCEEGYRFANCVIAGKSPFVYPVSEPDGFGRISFPVEIPEDFENVKVRVVYMKEPFQYVETNELLNQYYESEATIDDNMVCAEIPNDAYSYYVEFVAYTNGKRLVSTTALITKKDMESEK